MRPSVFMRRNLLSLCFVCLVLLFPLATSAAQHFSAQVSGFDPPAGVELDAYDKLFLKLEYASEVKVRFKVVPLRNGVELEYGAMTSSTTLWPPGENEALAWVSFSTSTRVDEVRIVALDAEWHKINQFGVKLDTVWTSEVVDEPRAPAEWVRKLMRTSRLRQEFAFDPNPQQKQVVYDTFFYVTVLVIPFYLILQLQFLRLWRGRWRELAAIPIVSITPMVFLAILGLGIELRLWIIFIFRGMPLALIYLCGLWVARRLTLRNKTDGPGEANN